MREVSDFVVIAPEGLEGAVAKAEQRLVGHLASRFPHYNFRIEGAAPSVDPEDFTIIPIMNRPRRPDDTSDPDALFMCRPLDPRVIPQIQEALREFRFSADAAN